MSGAALTCEYCDLSLGVFKRKRMCPGCSRWFCTSCLPREYSFQIPRTSDFATPASNIRLGRNPLGPTPICQRCSILAIENVTKEHLMELRVKDLRQYLESKRIPIAGCREKAELVDLVLQHCCSDAFLQQQAENQRRLRELTRRKEAEEEWEQRRRRQNADSSPDSMSDTQPPPRRRVSSSPETSSGADDPNDDSMSIGAEMEMEPDPRRRFESDQRGGGSSSNDAVAAEPALPTRSFDPVFEIVDNGLNDFDQSVELGVDAAAVENPVAIPLAGGGDDDVVVVGTVPSTRVAPPTYDEVMAAGTDNGAAATDSVDPLISNAATSNASSSPSSSSRVQETNGDYGAPSPPAAPLAATLPNSVPSSPFPPGASSSSSPLIPPASSPYSSSLDAGGTGSQPASPGRFQGRRRIRLEEIERKEDVKELSPRQLKEILASNFVAFKGCCERWELEDRVHRLWTEHRANQEMLRAAHERDAVDAASSGGTGDDPAADAGASAASKPPPAPDVDANICKICWDAVIDCVLLECGHMVTCTDCGRRMSECPICRQYVVRAVHVFRA